MIFLLKISMSAHKEIKLQSNICQILVQCNQYQYAICTNFVSSVHFFCSIFDITFMSRLFIIKYI